MSSVFNHIVSSIEERDALKPEPGMVVVVNNTKDIPDISDDYIAVSYIYMQGEWVLYKLYCMEISANWDNEPPCDEGDYWICTKENELSIVHVSFDKDANLIIQKFGDEKQYTLDDLDFVSWLPVDKPTLFPGELDYA